MPIPTSNIYPNLSLRKYLEVAALPLPAVVGAIDDDFPRGSYGIPDERTEYVLALSNDVGVYLTASTDLLRYIKTYEVSDQDRYLALLELYYGSVYASVQTTGQTTTCILDEGGETLISVSTPFNQPVWVPWRFLNVIVTDTGGDTPNWVISAIDRAWRQVHADSDCPTLGRGYTGDYVPPLTRVVRGDDDATTFEEGVDPTGCSLPKDYFLSEMSRGTILRVARYVSPRTDVSDVSVGANDVYYYDGDHQLADVHEIDDLYVVNACTPKCVNVTWRKGYSAETTEDCHPYAFDIVVRTGDPLPLYQVGDVVEVLDRVPGQWSWGAGTYYEFLIGKALIVERFDPMGLFVHVQYDGADYRLCASSVRPVTRRSRLLPQVALGDVVFYHNETYAVTRIGDVSVVLGRVGGSDRRREKSVATVPKYLVEHLPRVPMEDLTPALDMSMRTYAAFAEDTSTGDVTLIKTWSGDGTLPPEDLAYVNLGVCAGNAEDTAIKTAWLVDGGVLHSFLTEVTLRPAGDVLSGGVVDSTQAVYLRYYPHMQPCVVSSFGYCVFSDGNSSAPYKFVVVDERECRSDPLIKGNVSRLFAMQRSF